MPWSSINSRPRFSTIIRHDLPPPRLHLYQIFYRRRLRHYYHQPRRLVFVLVVSYLCSISTSASNDLHIFSPSSSPGMTSDLPAVVPISSLQQQYQHATTRLGKWRSLPRIELTSSGLSRCSCICCGRPGWGCVPVFVWSCTSEYTFRLPGENYFTRTGINNWCLAQRDSAPCRPALLLWRVIHPRLL